MEIAQRNEGPVTVATPRWHRIDARSAAELKTQLSEIIEAGRSLIVLDVSGVDFIDSSGLGAIVSALKQLGGRGDLVVAGAKPAVRNLFKLTRMDKVIRLFDAPEDAVSALRAH